MEIVSRQKIHWKKNMGDSWATNHGKGFYNIRVLPTWHSGSVYQHELKYKKKATNLLTNGDIRSDAIQDVIFHTRLVLTEKTFFYVPRE